MRQTINTNYIRVCLKFGKIIEAQKTINGNVNNEIFTEEQKEKMKTLKKQMDMAQQRKIAESTLESGEGVQRAMKASGLSETEVLQINRQINSNNIKNTKSDNKELNK